MRVGACGGGRGKGREEGDVGGGKERRGRGGGRRSGVRRY